MVKNEALSDYIISTHNRVAHLDVLYGKMNSFLDNRLQTNGKLNARGAGILRLGETVELAQLTTVPDPLDEGSIGRFAWGFHMAEGYDDDEHRIPITIESVLRLPHEFTGDTISRLRDHRSRPAYYRGLALFGGFFVNLTTEISDSPKPPAHLGPELFVAWNIMTRLVDTRDPGAIRPDASVAKSYLFTPNPKISYDHLKSAG